jgi:hypothetical protein
MEVGRSQVPRQSGLHNQTCLKKERREGEERERKEMLSFIYSLLIYMVT